MKRALITGITGQDGSYLAELLLGKGYKVFGYVRQHSWYSTTLSPSLVNAIQPIFGELTDGVEISSAIEEAKPDEIYNLASQSRPGESWSRAPETLQINGLGAIRLFEAVRNFSPSTKVYHASSSEMYGNATTDTQNELTPFNPANPYAASKVYAHQMANIYRESYGLFISCGILFNHESERRPLHFVTQKIAYGAACAALGINDSKAKNERGNSIVANGKLSLGNLNVARDWGYAADFVKAMWLMLQIDEAEDFVIGTGQLNTLKSLCNTAYNYVGLNWEDFIEIDPKLVRPIETSQTLADASKAKKVLNWRPSVSFDEMVGKMVEAQMSILKRDY